MRFIPIEDSGTRIVATQHECLVGFIQYKPTAKIGFVKAAAAGILKNGKVKMFKKKKKSKFKIEINEPDAVEINRLLDSYIK